MAVFQLHYGSRSFSLCIGSNKGTICSQVHGHLLQATDLVFFLQEIVHVRYTCVLFHYNCGYCMVTVVGMFAVLVYLSIGCVCYCA